MRNLALVAALLGPLTFVACASDEHDDHDDSALMEEAYENVEGGKEDGGCSGVLVPDRNGFAKRVALTFDDGPNPATTPKVIEVLKKHRAPAAFFTNGSRYAAAGATQLAAQIAADPDYLLANHSSNHLNLAEQTAATVAAQIDGTDRLIRAAGETPRYFRFPFGASTCASKQQAQDRGYIVTGWHIDSADWCYAASGGSVCRKSTFKHVPDDMRNDMKAYVMSQVRAKNGGILLFHDIHQSTADQLDGILTTLEAEGFTFVRMDDTAAFPRLHGITPKFIGDTCDEDKDCTFGGGRCHAAGFCTQACNGSCPDATGKAPTFCIADDSIANAGMCVSKTHALNQECRALPMTESRSEARFLGTSSASAATANVCAPL